MTRQEIGGYQIVRQIGYGGMSTVYEAVDGVGRHVALKLLHPHIANSADGRERFRREVRMMQKVKGAHIAEVLDVETDEDDAFIVTQLIEGDTLEDDVDERGRFTEGELVKLARDLREAVYSIHGAGVLHRDLKPSNVMMKGDKPVLIDFGIAQLGDDPRFTQAGFVTQTPGYCDPLVVQGAEPSMQADWWALTAVLAFAATGYPPFGSDGTLQVTNRVLNGDMYLPHLSPEIGAAFRRALSPNASERITYDELIAIIENPSSAPEILGDLRTSATRNFAMDGGVPAGGTRGGGVLAGGGQAGVGHHGAGDVLRSDAVEEDLEGDAFRANESQERVSSLEQSAFASWQDVREPDEAFDHERQRTVILGENEGHTEVVAYGELTDAGLEDDSDISAEDAPFVIRSVLYENDDQSDVQARAGLYREGATVQLPTVDDEAANENGATRVIPVADNAWRDGSAIDGQVTRVTGAAGGATAQYPVAGGLPGGANSLEGSTVAMPTQPLPATPHRDYQQAGGQVPHVAPNQRGYGPRGQQDHPGAQGYSGSQERVGQIQPPYSGGVHQPFPGQEAPGVEIPKWLRPPAPARLPVVLIGLALLLLAASWPLVSVIVFGVLSVFAAIVGVALGDLNRRRMTKGGRFSGERFWISVRLPWTLVKACLSQVLGLTLGLGFGGLVTWLVSLLNPADLRIAPVAGAAVMFTMSWFMGGNNPAREGARRIAAGVAPSVGYRAFWVAVLLLLVGGVGLAQFDSERPPNWAPIQEPVIFSHH